MGKEIRHQTLMGLGQGLVRSGQGGEPAFQVFPGFLLTADLGMPEIPELAAGKGRDESAQEIPLGEGCGQGIIEKARRLPAGQQDEGGEDGRIGSIAQGQENGDQPGPWEAGKEKGIVGPQP